MTIPKAPHDNPYWDDHIKPHRVDTDEIRTLCLEAFQILLGSHGVASLYTRDDDDKEPASGPSSLPYAPSNVAATAVEPDGGAPDTTNLGDEDGADEAALEEDGPTRLLALYRARSERSLSNALLKISILIRTLQDQITEEGEAPTFEAALTDVTELEGPLGIIFDVPEGQDDEPSLRECCNKIIHAEDFRPVYDNSHTFGESGGWAMDGGVELRGRRGKKEWSVTLYLTAFLEVVLAFCDVADKAR